jgi:hypothetical protein
VCICDLNVLCTILCLTMYGPSHKRLDFQKKCVWYGIYCNFVWNFFPSRKTSTTYYRKHSSVFICSAQCFCQSLIKLEISWPVLIKIPIISFHENRSIQSQVLPYGQRDLTNLLVNMSKSRRQRAGPYRQFQHLAFYCAVCINIIKC